MPNGSGGFGSPVQALQDPEGALERMLEEATAAVAAREPADDHEVLAVAWGRIAAVHAWRGETEAYMDALERALRTLDRRAVSRSRSALRR